MLKGMNQWCYPEGTPIDDIFRYSNQAGFDAVELNVNPKDDVGLTMDTSIKEAEALAAMAADAGLQLKSLSTALLWETPLSADDEAIREQGKQVVKRQLEFASTMGMDTILVVPGVVTASTSYEQCWQRSQAALEELLPIAELYQVKIGIENVWNKFLFSSVEMARFVDELDSPYLGVYFDVGNVVRFGYPEHWIRELGERILKVHVKDFNETNGFVPLLAGDVNWKAVVKALRNIGYDDLITAELTPYSIGPEFLAKDAGRQMDAIIHCAD